MDNTCRGPQNNVPIFWEEFLGCGSDQTRIRAGDLIFRAGEVPTIGLIRAGLVRVYIRTHAGRQLTIRYARAGDLIGLAPLLGGARAWNAEAVVSVVLSQLSLEQVQAAAARHPELPWLTAENVAAWASDLARTLAEDTSQQMIARVARHLRELALSASDGRPVAYVSHQRLADAVGTVREVITRQLRTLKADGVIETRSGRVIVVNEERLGQIAAARSLER
jgi:CRP/FNR family transcriptional regulator